MKRILITAGAALLVAVPASVGLVGNTSFSQSVPVRVPARATFLSDDHGSQRSAGTTEPGDDHGGRRGTSATEPGDDHGGQRPTTTPSVKSGHGTVLSGSADSGQDGGKDGTGGKDDGSGQP
ncbi:MAG: hypothetical protein ABI903_15595 [Actinomycetota bacterium]